MNFGCQNVKSCYCFESRWSSFEALDLPFYTAWIKSKEDFTFFYRSALDGLRSEKCWPEMRGPKSDQKKWLIQNPIPVSDQPSFRYTAFWSENESSVRYFCRKWSEFRAGPQMSLEKSSVNGPRRGRQAVTCIIRVTRGEFHDLPMTALVYCSFSYVVIHILRRIPFSVHRIHVNLLRRAETHRVERLTSALRLPRSWEAGTR